MHLSISPGSHTFPPEKKKNSRSRTLAHVLFTLHDPGALCWLCFNFRCVYEIGGN